MKSYHENFEIIGVFSDLYRSKYIKSYTDWSGWTRLPTLPEGVPEIDVDPISLSGLREVGHI